MKKDGRITSDVWRIEKSIASIEKVEELVETGMSASEALKQIGLELSPDGVDDSVGFTFEVDRKIKALEALKMKLEWVKEQENSAKRARKSLENVTEALKKNFVRVMNDNPELMFHGSDKRLALQKNPTSLKLRFDTYTMSDLVTLDTIEEFQLPAKCYTTMVVHKLDKTACKKIISAKHDKKQMVIKDGTYIEGATSWGSMESGQHLRVR